MGDRLGIGRCEVGQGGPLMLRSPKLQIRASDHLGPKMGVLKIAPPNFFLIWCHLPMGSKLGGAKSSAPPCVHLRGQLPIVKAQLGVEEN